MTEPNSLDEEAVVVEGDQVEETEEIIAEYGIVLLQNLDGNGVNIQHINKGVVREATIDDIVSLIRLADSHMQGNVIAAKVSKILQGQMRKKVVVPGIRGAR